MTTETLETTPQQVDQEIPETTQTEAPATEVVAEGAAAPAESAAAPEQVQVTEPEKPEYMTRADWEREKAEVASRAASDALELDRRRRQTENARRAKAEAEQIASDQEAVDTLKAALGAKGIYEVPDDAALAAINRIASKKAERMASSSFDTVDAAWDYLTAPAYGKNVDLDPDAATAAARLGPKLHHLVNSIRPEIEAQARKGYIPVSELDAKVKAGVDAALAARAATSREGETELRRVEGVPASGVMSWSAYMSLPEEQRMAMPAEERQKIMAADRKARLGP